MDGWMDGWMDGYIYMCIRIYIYMCTKNIYLQKKGGGGPDSMDL